jgi:hypothetical protein
VLVYRTGREEKDSDTIKIRKRRIVLVSGLGIEEKDSARLLVSRAGKEEKYSASIKSRYREREHCTNVHTVCKFQSIWQRFR